VIPHKQPVGMQGFIFNTRRDFFSDRKVREAIGYAFDFEWSNKALFFGQYTRTRSYYQNSEMAATGTPSPEELEILNPLKGQIPDEVFTTEYNPPVTDGTGNPRENLEKAANLLEEAGWKVENGPQSVAAAPEKGDALAVFTIAAEGDDPVAVANEVVRKASLDVDGGVETTRMGGLPAARASGRTREGWTTTYRHLVAWIAQGGAVYQIAGTTREGDWSRYADALTATVGSVRPLSAADRDRVREARLHIVDAKRGESLDALLARSDSAWSPERAAAANGLAANAALQPGQSVKVARWEPYTPAPQAH